jgi:hypothetical protein
VSQWTVEKAWKAITAAKRDKEASDDIYREAMELTFPDRENFVKRQEGQQKAQYNWDSTPQVSVIRAANRLSSDFTPQFQSWFEIGLGAAAQQMDDEVFKKAVGKAKDEAKRELEAITSIVQAVFNGPGFPTASNETYIDWHFGQGGMKIMPNDDFMGEPVVFQAMPMSHFYAYEGPNGRLDRWFFWHELRADAITQEWKDAKLPKELEEEAAKPSPGMVKLASVVYRDYDDKVKPFRYEVFWQKGSNKARLVERQSRTAPFVTPRYSKLPGENRGRGPVIFALPDIRTANKIVELTLRAVAVAVAGVYTATENAVNGPIAIKPYSIIKVRRNGGPDGPSLQRLDNPQRIDFGELVLDTLHMNIRKVIGDNSLPPEAGPIRTATEFIQRARELVADQAGGLGRLYAEFIIPSVQRVVDILESKQILPTQGLQIDQFLIEVRMTSPLARGEAMSEVENIVRFMEMLKAIGGPELMAYEVDLEAVTPRLGDLMNVPMDVRTTKEQKLKLKRAAAQQQAAAQGGDPNVAAQSVDAQEEAAQNGGR